MVWTGMRKLFLTFLLILGASAGSAAAQDLLPAAFSRWNASEAAQKTRPDALEQLAGADAGIYREYGLVEAERRAYSFGAATLKVTLYRMRDSTAGYGIYSFLRSDEMSAANLTKYSAISHQHVLVLIGNLLLDVTGGEVRPYAGDLKALAALLAPQAARAPYPTLGQHLPTRGLVADSQRYFVGPQALNRALPLGKGDWLGFADGAEAELARYRINGQEATLLLASYPTPQVAANKFEELARWLPMSTDAQPGDGRSTLFARRTSSLLAIVAQNPSRALADSLLQEIHYESQVTWNEPSHKLTDPSIDQILVGTIVGTGVILMFALVAGIGFGGVRLVVKYFFPGRVFDRDTQVEILQLGLTSKPIEAKDFY
jgi:hypothetical protein